MNFRAADGDANLLSLARRLLGPQWGAVARLVQLAAEHGMAAYLVGGQVRDLLLAAGPSNPKLPPPCPRDVDLLVVGDAPTLARAAVATLGGASTLADNMFLTARWQPPNGAAIDLATARTESYAAPAALPAVRPAALEQDLGRRDFTINAMALGLGGPDVGALYDPFGGRADLHRGLLRVLHGQSFFDDPTRMLRAARFAARLDLNLAPDTRSLLADALEARVLHLLSPARLGAELDLLLGGPEVVRAFHLLHQWGLLSALDLAAAADAGLLTHLAAGFDARNRLARFLAAVPGQAAVLWLVLAAHLSGAQRQAAAGWVHRGGGALRRWRTGPEKLREARRALDGADAGRRNVALAALDPVERTALFAQGLSRAHEATLLWWEQVGQHVRTVITGHTLMARGHLAGPGIRCALAAALVAAQAGADAAAQLAVAEAALGAPPGTTA